MKLKFTIPNSVSAKLKGVVSRGIKAMEVDERGHLLVTLTDNTVVDLGKVKGDPGVYVGAEEPTDDSVLVWFTDDGEAEDSEDLLAVLADMQRRIEALEKAIGGGDVPDTPDVPDVPDVPVKLAAPTIRLVKDGEDSGGDVPDAGTLTPAILGVAILGRTILGMTDVGGEKLAAPVIELTTSEVLAAPEIELVEV